MVDGDTGRSAFEPFHERCGQHGNAAVAEGIGQRDGDVFVRVRDEAGRRLEGNVGAELTSLHCCGGPDGSAAEYEDPHHRSTVRRLTPHGHHPKRVSFPLERRDRPGGQPNVEDFTLCG